MRYARPIGNAHAETIMRRIEEDITCPRRTRTCPAPGTRADGDPTPSAIVIIQTPQPEPTRLTDDLIKSLSVRHQVMVVIGYRPDLEEARTVDVKEKLPDFLLRLAAGFWKPPISWRSDGRSSMLDNLLG